MSGTLTETAGIAVRRRDARRRAEGEPDGEVHCLGFRRAAGVDAARSREPRPRRLHQERHRLSRRAHDRRGRGQRAALFVRRQQRNRRASAACAARAPQPDAMRARPAGGLVRASDGGGERLSRGGVGRGAVARAACVAPRPHEIGAGPGRLAGSLRLCGGGPDGALRAGRRGCAPSCTWRCSIRSTTITA